MTSTAKPGAMKARKRIALACNGCRTKRTKCDGDQPKCSSCSYREEECVYTDSESKRKRPSNAYILALESRVEFLERHLEAALGTPGKYTTTSSRSDIYSPISNKNGDLSSLTSDPPRESRTPRDQTSVDDLTEALGCFTLGDTGELRFFGASSNFNIIQNPSLKVASSLEARSRGIAAARQRAGYFEPSAELRDHLLGLFWRWQNSWQYIVCRESFVRDLYMEKTGRYCTPLLLMAIMALSSRYSPRPELRTDAADANTAGAIFAQQAKTMLDCEYEAPTTSTVQATAILGLYWASIDNEGQGFMYIGMASRMAMNLGLHCDCSYYATKGLISQKDVEERSIAFWGIYVLDKLYCLGMGRPASIQERNITTPKPIVKDYPVPQLSGPLKKISSPWPTYHITENSLYTCELLMFTSEVIDKLYAQRSEWTYQEREDGVMQIHLRATRFLDHLPKTLKISYSSLQPSPPYAYQLHLQYYHSIVLLHRPFLNHFSGSRQSIEYDPSGGDIHSSSCRSAAMRICEIFRIYGKNFGNRHLPVSAVHPAFTAAILLLLDLKMRQDRNINTEASAKAFKETKHYLSISVVALYEMNINWNWANRSIRAVQSLAAQWKVDLSTLDLERVPDESWGQYNLYVSECITTEQLQTPLTGVTEQGDENGSTAPAFDFPPWLNGISSLPPFDQTIDPHPDPDPLDDSQFWANMGLLFGCQEP